jgi:hypothetical protein
MDGKYDVVVSMDDTSLGFSARDVANAFGANGDGRLQWFDGTQTILHIFADTSQGTVAINDPPLDPKYCAPSMDILNVTLAVSTDDGRLDETMVSRLVAIGRGTPTAVWPQDFAVSLSQLRGALQLPTEWTSGFEQESIKLLINSKIDSGSPYCRTGEKPDLSTTSTSECTAWSGKIMYWGDHQPDQYTAPVFVNQVVGWWIWQ